MSQENDDLTSGDGNTNANTSGTNSTPTSSDSAITGVTLKQIEELFDRKLQSMKDRRISGLEKQVDSIREKLAKDLEKEGYDPVEVKQVTDRLRNTDLNKSETTSNVVGSGKTNAEVPVADTILKVAGLASDDPDVTNFNQREYASEAEKAKEALALAARKMSNPPAPKAPLDVKTSGQPTLDDKVKELNDYMRSPVRKDPEVVRKLTEEIEQLK